MALSDLILVTGVTGYVGKTLIPLLLDKGYRVRVLVRDPSRLRGVAWLDCVEVAEGDTLNLQSLSQAMLGVSSAYYLVHNMSSGRHYVERDMESARNFTAKAEEAGVNHIIYLGGLANMGEKIGRHMQSRIDTGNTLREGRTPVTEFRASLIIGSGSISFEMIRYLTEQLPVIPAPAWLHNRVQPISVENVLDYMVAALEDETSRGKIYEIGGEDVITYLETLTTYASLRGLKRSIIILPYLPVPLLAYFASKLTPVPMHITQPLIEGMRSSSVVKDGSALKDFPGVRLIDYRTAVQKALDRLVPSYLELKEKKKEGSYRMIQEGFQVEIQRVEFEGDPLQVYQTLTNLGGRKGWLYLNWIWKVRGLIDRLLGGPGMRGRPLTGLLAEGDQIDFYQVETLRPGRMMRLKSELKAPGAGWMEWRVHPRAEGRVELEQIAYFIPHGLPGFLYWNILRPVHLIVFKGMIRAIARQSVLEQRQSDEIELLLEEE